MKIWWGNLLTRVHRSHKFNNGSIFNHTGGTHY